MTEAQLRKMIRKEILKEMANMEPEKEKPGIGFSPKQMAAMAAAGLIGNATFAQLQNFFHENPEILKVVKAYLQSKGLMEE
jgi:hypothetical protein